jgi:hypothetical protein
MKARAKDVHEGIEKFRLGLCWETCTNCDLESTEVLVRSFDVCLLISTNFIGSY